MAADPASGDATYRHPFGELSADGIQQIVLQLAALDPERRQIVQLYYVDQFSIADIATETGKSPDFVTSLLDQTLQQFRQAYRASADDPTARDGDAISHDS